MVLREGHPLNSECWEGDLEVEFVTTFLGGLPGLSCRWTRAPQVGAPSSQGQSSKRATQINFQRLSNPKLELV